MSPTLESTLADPQQTNADLQRQLAECRAERDEALARETAMGDVLRVINSSPGNLAPVVDAMLEKAMRLCGAAFGTLWTSRSRLKACVITLGSPPLSGTPHPSAPPASRVSPSPIARRAPGFRACCRASRLDGRAA